MTKLVLIMALFLTLSQVFKHHTAGIVFGVLGIFVIAIIVLKSLVLIKRETNEISKQEKSRSA